MNVRRLAVVLLFLIAGASAFAWARQRAIRRASGVRPVAGESEKHRVTPAMLRSAEARNRRPAPAFRRDDADGITRDLAEMLGHGPVVLVFIKDGCPCSASAETYFNAIHAAFRGRLQFLGVIDGDARIARRWASEQGVPFPVIPDPRLELAHAYGATNSAFVALIDRDGTVEEFWPGYSSGMLRDLNRRAARLAAVEEPPLDPADAPEDLYSGCPFGAEDPPPSPVSR